VTGRRAMAASFLLFIIFFAAIEAVMTIAGAPAIRPELLITEIDPVLLSRNRSNLSLVTFPRNVRVSTNRDGFRGPEIDETKPAGTYRIVAMGDSATFGYGVGDDETFCARLQLRLNGDSGLARLRYEVINAGVIGYTTVQGLRVLKRTILRLKPDCLVVSYAINDATLSWGQYYFPGKRMSEIPGLSPSAVWLRNLLFNNSRVCRWALMKILLERRAVLDERCDDKIVNDTIRRVPPDEYMGNLAEFARIARDNGIAVAYLPMPVRIRASIYPDYEPDTAIRDRESSLAVVRTVVKGIKGTKDRKILSMMHYFLGGQYVYLGNLRKALDAYMTAVKYSDGRREYRWQNCEYCELMLKAAEKEKVILRNILPTFCLRELTDNPSDLYEDFYHPGPLGHEIIAHELHGVIGDLVRARKAGKKSALAAGR